MPVVKHCEPMKQGLWWRYTGREEGPLAGGLSPSSQRPRLSSGSRYRRQTGVESFQSPLSVEPDPKCSQVTLHLLPHTAPGMGSRRWKHEVTQNPCDAQIEIKLTYYVSCSIQPCRNSLYQPVTPGLARLWEWSAFARQQDNRLSFLKDKYNVKTELKKQNKVFCDSTHL